MVTGIVSFLASTTIIISIKRSNIKLTNIYRRIIFLTSFFDIFQSLSQAASSIPMPSGAIWGAIGNDASCDAQGFLVIFGASGAVWYSVSLTLYFFLVVVVKIPELKIKGKIEPFLHGFPILYSLSASIVCLVTGNLNPLGTMCRIAEEPLGCLKDDDVECSSKANPKLLGWVAIGVPVFLAFILNCTMLALILWNMKHQDEASQQYRHSWLTEQKSNEDEETEGRGIFRCMMRRKKQEAQLGPLVHYLSRPSAASVRRIKEISNRAMAYIGGYFCTYLFSAIYR